MTTSSRRRGPVGRFSDVRGSRRGGRAPPSSARPCPIVRKLPAGWASRRDRPAQASAASAPAPGGGAGNGTAAGPAGGGPGLSSTSCARTASPPIPSASTWFITITRPVPPPARPVTNVADHNGRDRGSGSPSTDPATSSRARWSPGAGQGTCRTWWHRSNAGSSAQNGRPHPGGARCSRCRSLGTAAIRSPSSRRACSTLNPGPVPSTSTAPVCIGAGPTSAASCIRSAGLARSTGTRAALRAPATPSVAGGRVRRT